jgi:hypothetical protein
LVKRLTEEDLKIKQLDDEIETFEEVVEDCPLADWCTPGAAWCTPGGGGCIQGEDRR